MVPKDHREFPGKTGHILDDDLYRCPERNIIPCLKLSSDVFLCLPARGRMIVEKLPEDSELFCIFDCCHSGTILDLPFTIKVTPPVAKKMEEVHFFLNGTIDGNLACPVHRRLHRKQHLTLQFSALNRLLMKSRRWMTIERLRRKCLMARLCR